VTDPDSGKTVIIRVTALDREITLYDMAGQRPDSYQQYSMHGIHPEILVDTFNRCIRGW